jgi:hypothetical protein
LRILGCESDAVDRRLSGVVSRCQTDFLPMRNYITKVMLFRSCDARRHRNGQIL